MKIKKIVLFLIFVFIITSGFGCTKKPGSANVKPVTLKVWGVYENAENLEPLFNAFRRLHPTVSFEYRKFTPEEYEQRLTNAWVEETGDKSLGPDIYFLQNSLVNAYSNKITPLPEQVTLPYREVKQTGIGSFQKTDVYNYTRQERTISLNDLSNLFAPVVYDDVVINNKIYGLPLSIDTIALFYNKKMLDSLNIATPPKNWEDFVKYVKDISLLNEDKTDFVQSGTALGTTNNITNAVDILILLIKQSGIEVNKSNNLISFGSDDQQKEIALKAIEFYTNFANPIKEAYSWDETIENDALSRFKNKRLAFFFGYPYNIEQIDSNWYNNKKTSPNSISFDIAPMPQITKKTIDKNGNEVQVTTDPINFADYWVMTVSHKTKNKDLAWGFIDFATDEKNVKLYLDKTNKPTALRNYFNKQTDPTVNVFAGQILSANSWYHGKRYDLAKQSIKEMIDTFRTKNMDLAAQKKLLNNTATNINQDIK